MCLLPHVNLPLLAEGTVGLIALANAAAAQDDAEVYARIDLLRPVAQNIVIDGTGADWGAIPTFADPVGDATGTPGEDITGVAIAPLDDALLVRIEFCRAWRHAGGVRPQSGSSPVKNQSRASLWKSPRGQCLPFWSTRKATS